MNKIIDHRHAHQLSDLYHKSDRSLCVLVKDSKEAKLLENCLLYTSPSPRDLSTSRMPSSA